MVACPRCGKELKHMLTYRFGQATLAYTINADGMEYVEMDDFQEDDEQDAASCYCPNCHTWLDSNIVDAVLGVKE